MRQSLRKNSPYTSTGKEEIRAVPQKRFPEKAKEAYYSPNSVNDGAGRTKPTAFNSLGSQKKEKKGSVYDSKEQVNDSGDLQDASFLNAVVKFLSAVDRLMKEKDSFILRGMKAFVELVATTVPGILETIRGDIQQNYIRETPWADIFFNRPRSVGIHKGIMYSNEPALLLDMTMDMQIAIEQNRSVKAISDFSSNIGVFFELIGHSEPYAADLASECVVLLLKAAERESNMGFLTDLSKLNSFFQYLHDRVSGLLLVFSGNFCTPILVPGNDLIPLHQALKTFSKTEVSDAASLLCLELQRLPRV